MKIGLYSGLFRDLSDSTNDLHNYHVIYEIEQKGYTYHSYLPGIYKALLGREGWLKDFFSMLADSKIGVSLAPFEDLNTWDTGQASIDLENASYLSHYSSVSDIYTAHEIGAFDGTGPELRTDMVVASAKFFPDKPVRIYYGSLAIWRGHIKLDAERDLPHIVHWSANSPDGRDFDMFRISTLTSNQAARDHWERITKPYPFRWYCELNVPLGKDAKRIRNNLYWLAHLRPDAIMVRPCDRKGKTTEPDDAILTALEQLVLHVSK